MPAAPLPPNNDLEHEDQGYFMSISDMMSGLLFIFIITLMVFVISFKDQEMAAQAQEQQFREEKGKAEREKDRLNIVLKDVTDAKDARRQLLEDLQKSLEQQGVVVRIDVEKGLLHVPEDVLFKSGRAELLEGGENSLNILAEHLRARLPCYTGPRDAPRPEQCVIEEFKPGRLEAVFVEGHTDNVPFSSGRFEDNWDLSARRSIVSYRLLLAAQPELGALTNANGEPIFGVSGYADTRPVVAHDAICDEPLNRRIDLRFLLALPTVEDVKSSIQKEEK